MSDARVKGTLRLKRPTPPPVDDEAVTREIAELMQRDDEEVEALTVALLSIED